MVGTHQKIVDCQKCEKVKKIIVVTELSEILKKHYFELIQERGVSHVQDSILDELTDKKFAGRIGNYYPMGHVFLSECSSLA